jgi:hypothetical protein
MSVPDSGERAPLIGSDDTPPRPVFNTSSYASYTQKSLSQVRCLFKNCQPTASVPAQHATPTPKATAFRNRKSLPA